MTAVFLEVNRFVAEQALIESLRARDARETARARRILAAIDKRKGVASYQRLDRSE